MCLHTVSYAGVETLAVRYVRWLAPRWMLGKLHGPLYIQERTLCCVKTQRFVGLLQNQLLWVIQNDERSTIFPNQKLKIFGISLTVGRSSLYTGRAVGGEGRQITCLRHLRVWGKRLEKSVLVWPACPYSAKVFKKEGRSVKNWLLY